MSPEAHGSVAGAPSPEAAWKQAREAYRRGDFRRYIELISPDARDECLCELTFYIGMGLPSSPGEQQEMNVILRRHGLTDIPSKAGQSGSVDAPGLFSRQAIARIHDKVGLYTDVMTYLRRHRVGPPVPAMLAADLEDVKIEGDTATAKVPGFSDILKSDIGFSKIEGSWFIHLPPICLNDIFRNVPVFEGLASLEDQERIERIYAVEIQWMRDLLQQWPDHVRPREGKPGLETDHAFALTVTQQAQSMRFVALNYLSPAGRFEPRSSVQYRYDWQVVRQSIRKDVEFERLAAYRMSASNLAADDEPPPPRFRYRIFRDRPDGRWLVEAVFEADPSTPSDPPPPQEKPK